MTKKVCYLCERGNDRAFFCDICADNMKEGRSAEILVDLGLSLLTELRILNKFVHSSGSTEDISDDHRFYMTHVGDMKIRVIKNIRAFTGSSLVDAKRIADNMGFFEVKNKPRIAAEQFVKSMAEIGCIVSLDS